MKSLALKQLLADHLGLASDSLGDPVLASALAQRLTARSLADPAAYLDCVRRDPAELQALVEAVVVPETWFFRYPKSLEFLGDWARDRRTRLGTPLRLLSLPSSTGEEPYSVAMALLLAGLPPTGFTVDAVDVSARVVELARKGVYPPSAFRERSTPDLSPFFEVVGPSRRVRPEVAGRVTFRVGNVTDPSVFRLAARYDMILCRNLFIYLTEPARRAALDRFDRQLADGGLLFMGHAEPASLFDARFTPAGPAGAFAFARAAAPKPVAAPPRLTPPAKPPVVVPPPPAPSPACDPLLLAELAANRGEPAVALEFCRQALDAEPTAAGYTLLGVIRLGLGDRAGAERAFTEAVYLDPRHYDALVHLLSLAESRRDAAAAANYRRRAALAQSRGPA